ncbi:hypothetical protein INR49_002695 [Caranx melampygus]|nr:hypothetical protein INR49_002695 [Caranx melampygus]
MIGGLHHQEKGGSPTHPHPPHHPHHHHHHPHRVSLSDGSESDSSSPSPPSHNEAPPLLKTTNNQILEVKSPTKQSKQDKNKNMDCDKAYLDELVELHKRLMTLREGHILQQIVNLIEETGHFHITNTTFDFDLCSLDRTSVWSILPPGLNWNNLFLLTGGENVKNVCVEEERSKVSSCRQV